MKGWMTCLLVVAISVGCAPSAPPAASEEMTAEVTPVGDPSVSYPMDHAWVEVPPDSRNIKRLTVDMLELSIPVVAGENGDGPINWVLPNKKNGVQILAFGDGGLGKTLGRPDYVQVTEEPLEVTPLYVKFMDDMARNVCDQMVAHEYATDFAGEGALVRFADRDDTSDIEAIRANLRYLTLRFWAEWIDPGDAEGTAALEAAFFQALDAGDTPGGSSAKVGWHTVCVALFMSPSFHLY